MKFMMLVYTDPALIDALPEGDFDSKMRYCLGHADDLRRKGQLLDSQMLQPAPTARSMRVRNGRTSIVDGPFAEAKEFLAGFNLIEAENIDEAMEMAAEFPWARTGCIEVRPVLEIDSMRKRVGAAAHIEERDSVP